MVAFANTQDVGIDDQINLARRREQTKVTLRLVITVLLLDLGAFPCAELLLLNAQT